MCESETARTAIIIICLIIYTNILNARSAIYTYVTDTQTIYTALCGYIYVSICVYDVYICMYFVSHTRTNTKNKLLLVLLGTVIFFGAQICARCCCCRCCFCLNGPQSSPFVAIVAEGGGAIVGAAGAR